MYEFVKRFFDVSCASLGLLALSPLLAFVALGIRLQMGSPIFFRQARTGRYGETFQIAKFRTMRPPQPGEDASATDAQRITGFGRFLRSTSIDELPQLWNVLRGEMSLIGPRPLLPVYTARYNDRQRMRLQVPQGLTGLQQIRGRNSGTWEERFEWDAKYVEERGLWLDTRILFETVFRGLKREGISQKGHATCPEFQGTAPNPDEPETAA